MYCGKCGNKLIEDARFCEVCGTPIPICVQNQLGTLSSNHSVTPDALQEKPVQEPNYNAPKPDSLGREMPQNSYGLDRICPVCGRNVPWKSAGCVCEYPYNIGKLSSSVHESADKEKTIPQQPEQPAYVQEPPVVAEPMQPEQHKLAGGIQEQNDSKRQAGISNPENERLCFCEVCGKQLASDERFCERCGTATDKQDTLYACSASVGLEKPKTEDKPSVIKNGFPYIPAPGEEDKDRAAQVLKAYHKDDPNSTSHPYKKLGGFLMYDVVARIIALILEVGIGVFERVVYNEYRYLWRWLLSFLPRGQSELVTAVLVALNALIIIFIIMDLVQVILILCRSKWLLLFYQLTYILALLAGATMVVVTIVMFSQYTRFNNIYTGILPYAVDFIRLIVTFALWSRYYSHSVRVRVYMGSSEYLRKSLFNRRTKSPVPEFDENGYDIS